MTDLSRHMAAVATRLLGDPNKALSSPKEWRYGTRGSLSVDLEKGTWYDHEQGTGGGVIDLICRETGQPNGVAIEWLRAEGFDVEEPRQHAGRRIVANYPYRDEHGKLLFEVCRFEPKDFRQRAPDGAGGWRWSLKGVRRVLYRLPELVAASADTTVFLVEGEKDAERLASLDLIATTCPGGANKWRPEYTEALAGRKVVILPDNDPAGAEHAEIVKARLTGKAARIAVLALQGLPHKGDVSDWFNAGGTTGRLAELAEAVLAGAEASDVEGKATSAQDPTPYVWTDPDAIPRRQFLYGRHLSRKQVAVTVAPGGLGKSTLAITEALAMASGKNLLGEFVTERCRVWLYNLEDPRDELERRIQAAALHYGLKPDDIEGWLYVDTGRERPLMTTAPGLKGVEINDTTFRRLRAGIEANHIDVMIVDPFISSHGAPENDNTAIDALAKEWGRLADHCNCAVELIHHARKLNGEPVTAESSRGAKALVDAARDVRTLNRMTEDEAAQAGVENDRQFFRVQSDKSNLAPPEVARWYQMESVELPNGDSVGVVTPWQWPDAFDGMTTNDLLRVQRALDGKDAKENSQAGDWAGFIVAEVLDLDPDEDKHRIKTMLKTWVKTGALRVVRKADKSRHVRPVFEVKEWATS